MCIRDRASGDFVTIIGGNGAGKSTLFNAVAGVFYVDEGRVILEGEDMTFMPEYTRSNHLGRLFQDPLKVTCLLYTSTTMDTYGRPKCSS